MSFTESFNVGLMLLTIGSGVLRALKRLHVLVPPEVETAASVFAGFVADLFPFVAAVFVLRAFLYEPFRIPSGSMMPTLHIGDFILVDKFSYGLRRPAGACRPAFTASSQEADSGLQR